MNLPFALELTLLIMTHLRSFKTGSRWLSISIDCGVYTWDIDVLVVPRETSSCSHFRQLLSKPNSTKHVWLLFHVKRWWTRKSNRYQSLNVILHTQLLSMNLLLFVLSSLSLWLTDPTLNQSHNSERHSSSCFESAVTHACVDQWHSIVDARRRLGVSLASWPPTSSVMVLFYQQRKVIYSLTFTLRSVNWNCLYWLRSH